jgi:adenylate kinase
MNVLITGVQNHIEESIVRIAAERLQGKADFRLLSFSDFDELDGSTLDGLDTIKATQQKVRQSIQVAMRPGGRKSVIVNGYCTVKTKLGFFPVLTEESVKAFRPDMLVHISVDPLALEGKEKDLQGFSDYQALEKSYALLLCASAGCGMRIIHCGIEEARKASDELFSLLKDTMVDK